MEKLRLIFWAEEQDVVAEKQAELLASVLRIDQVDTWMVCPRRAKSEQQKNWISPEQAVSMVFAQKDCEAIVIAHQSVRMPSDVRECLDQCLTKWTTAGLFAAVNVGDSESVIPMTGAQAMLKDWAIAVDIDRSFTASPAYCVRSGLAQRLSDVSSAQSKVETFADFCQWVEQSVMQLGENELLCTGWIVESDQTSGGIVEENKEFRDFYKYYTQIQNNAPVILHLVQNDFSEGADRNVGGTQFHVKDLMLGQREKANVIVAARDGGFLRVTRYWQETRQVFLFYIGAQPQMDRRSTPQEAKIYQILLDVFQVDTVHIHHTMGLSLDLFQQAKKRNIPLFFTFHDFYYICPSIKLLDARNEGCIGKQTAQKCRECLAARKGIEHGDLVLEKWREDRLECLRLCDQLFAPSESAKQIVSIHFPEIAEKIKVIPHGVEQVRLEPGDKQISASGNKMNVAFIGSLSAEKGSRIARQLIENNDWIDWHIFGGIEDRELASLQRPNLKIYGWYKREQLPDLLREARIDLVCIFSIWAETFCYTLSEALSSGIPVIVTDIGALGERVRKNQCGWVVDLENTMAQTEGILHNLQNNPNLLEEKKNRVQAYTPKSLEEMAGEYLKAYEEYRRPIACHKADAEQVRATQKAKETADVVLFHKQDAGTDAYYYQAISELQEIKNSRSYRMLCKLKKMIPFKQQLRKIMEGWK